MLSYIIKSLSACKIQVDKFKVMQFQWDWTCSLYFKLYLLSMMDVNSQMHLKKIVHLKVNVTISQVK